MVAFSRAYRFVPCTWLHRPAQHGWCVMRSLSRPLHGLACQQDALGSFVHTKGHPLQRARLADQTEGDTEVWTGRGAPDGL